MTYHPIKTLPDGTRVYSNGTKYKPKRPEERINKILKPEIEGVVWWGGRWCPPLVLLQEELRQLPETVPDEEAYEHAAKPRRCKCHVCQRPQARKWRMKWKRDQIRTGSS
jgi:hypothetical protein